jgi:hypothetical protein
MCESTEFVLPNKVEDVDGVPVPICSGCAHILTEFSLGYVKRPRQISSSLDLADLSERELEQLALELSSAQISASEMGGTV